MNKPLKALLVEDVERDAELLVLELKRGGFDVTFERVQTAEAMSRALEKQPWDIVISDYAMPSFGAPAALALLKKHKLELPFIIVSDTVNETLAVEVMRAGAHDFMAKDNFSRLSPAIERELSEAAGRAERSKMKEQMLISERMASVGTLAAGVAHEINNPLTAVMANIQFASEDLAKLSQDLRAKAGDSSSENAATDWIATRLREIEEPLRDAYESADRVRLIVRDLKIFSRSDDEKAGPVDIRRVLESSLRMAWNEVRHRARLVKSYGEVPAVYGNEGRLGQVFLNLVINAAQAIPEGHADRNEIRVVTSEDARGNVVVEIRDSGPGIPEAVRGRIFDPFFTTKPMGEGTGLGLAICHRIVTALGGQIQVETQMGKGTVVRTILPIAADTAVHTPPPVIPAVPKRRGKILVVDDEAALGTALRRALSTEHDVMAVTSAQEAILKVADGERFDVIFCDLMMPEVTGMDLHATLTRLAPDQAEKVVFMTGGAFTSRAQEFFDQVINLRVEKPFDIANLRALVHGLLRPA
jgi:signal transduction histidine kinase